jgi:hypothetical protein
MKLTKSAISNLPRLPRFIQVLDDYLPSGTLPVYWLCFAA